MKQITFLSAATALALTIFSSCTKVDLVEQPLENELNKLKPGKSNCQSLSFVINNDWDYAPFQKTIDPVTQKISSIKAGVYTIVVQELLDMDIRYNNHNAYFLAKGSTTDTIMKANFDKQGNLLSIVGGNKPNDNYLPTYFSYKSGRVSQMKIDFMGGQLVRKFYYDANGNCIMRKEMEGAGYVAYTYNSARKAANQAYFHEPVGFSENTFLLAKYMEWLPSLKPVNLMTRTVVYWDDYQAMNETISDHQLDAKGNLISYKVNDIIHSTNWSCGSSPVVF